MADARPSRSTATHNSPRTWLLTAALSPLAVRLMRQLLSHGDYVVACLPPHEFEHEERSAEFRELISECNSFRKDREGWKDRIRGIRCDGRAMSTCGAAIAEAVEVFGRIDILLCCKSEGMLAISCDTLIQFTNICFSSSWYCRRTVYNASHQKPGSRSVRSHLLLPSQFHQGRIASIQKTAYGSHHGLN